MYKIQEQRGGLEEPWATVAYGQQMFADTTQSGKPLSADYARTRKVVHH